MDESKKASPPGEASPSSRPAESSSSPAPSPVPQAAPHDPVGQFLIVAGACFSSIGILLLLIKLAVLMDWMLAAIIAGLGLVMLVVGVIVR